MLPRVENPLPGIVTVVVYRAENQITLPQTRIPDISSCPVGVPD